MSELAWLAGILEGEGSFFLQRGRRIGVPAVSVEMCDLDTIERCAAAWPGASKIGIRQRSGRKPIYSIRWSGRVGTALMWAMLPQMSRRRSEMILDVLADGYDARFVNCLTCDVSFFVPIGDQLQRKHCPKHPSRYMRKKMENS